MGRRTGTIAITVVALALIVLAACGGEKPQAGAPPTSKTFDEAEWSIVTPAGWSREDITNEADAKKAIRYRAASGEYVVVAIDPLGSGYAYDALWQYEVKGSRFEIARKTECKGTSDPSCSDRDDRFDGYVLWKTGTTPVKVGGHTWYFVFGNSLKASADTGIFEEIVESLRVKA